METRSTTTREAVEYHGDHGERLTLYAADGLCLGEVNLPAAAGESAGHVLVEIVQQPCDPFGLPRGGPVVIDRERVSLTIGSSRKTGQFWLPDGWTVADWRACYFRIQSEPELPAPGC